GRQRELHIMRMMIYRPCVFPAGDMPRRRRDDITAARADIDAGTERRIVHRLGGEARNIGVVRSGEDDVIAAASRQRAPSEWQFAVLALKCPKAFVAAVARIGVYDDKPFGVDAEIGIGCGISPPMLDDARINRRRESAVRRELAIGMLGCALGTR